jgi:hypothetical protein
MGIAQILAHQWKSWRADGRGALLLSLVPVELGIAWALFDEDHLCWLGRLSRTCLRNR